MVETVTHGVDLDCGRDFASLYRHGRMEHTLTHDINVGKKCERAFIKKISSEKLLAIVFYSIPSYNIENFLVVS